MNLVLLHGYGGTAAEMRTSLAAAVDGPGLRVTALEAPYPCDLFPSQRQWFPLTRIGSALSAHVERASAVVADRIAPLAEEGRTIVVGHSQGGAIAAHLALSGTLRNIVSICISSPAPSLPAARVEPAASLTFIHGDSDPLVPLDEVRAGLAGLTAAGIGYDLLVVAGAGHALDPPLTSVAAERIRRLGIA